MHITTQRTHRFAFTLVELLVVIGIIALLVSIILPVLSRAREAGNKARCLSNLRQIGQAIHMYANDNRGSVFPEQYMLTPERYSWVHLLILGKYLTVPEQHATDFDLSTMISTGDSVFRCPTGINSPWTGRNGPPILHDPGMVTFWRYTAVGPAGQIILQFDSWYCLNSSGGNAGDPEGDFLKSPFRYDPADSASFAGAYQDTRIHKLSDFRNADELALLYDGIDAGSRSDFLSLRHDFGKSANLLMADGHAENVSAARLPQTWNDADDYVGYPKFILPPEPKPPGKKTGG